MALNTKIGGWALAGIVATGIGYTGTAPNKPIDHIQPQEIASLRGKYSKTFETGMMDTTITATGEKIITPILRMETSAELQHYRLAEDIARGDTLWKEPDKSVKAKPFLIKPFSRHSHEITAGPFRAEFNPEKPWNYQFESGGAGIEYTALFDTMACLEIPVTPKNNGIKETLILQAGAPVQYDWKLTVDGELRATPEGGWEVLDGAGTAALHIPPLTASDANGEPVMVAATVHGDTLSAVVDTTGVNWPVSLDPSTYTGIWVKCGGVVSYAQYSFNSSRDDAGGQQFTYADGGYMPVGIQHGSDNKISVGRTVMTFSTVALPAGAIIDTSSVRVRLFQAAQSGGLATQYCNLVSGTWTDTETVDATVYSKFQGRVVGGAHTSTKLLESDYPLPAFGTQQGAWLEYRLSDIGEAAIVRGDTTKFMMLTVADLNNVSPTFTAGADQYHNIYGYGGGYELVVTYHMPPPVLSPLNFRMDTPTPNSIVARWTPRHSANVDSQAVRNAADSSLVAKTPGKQDSSITVTGLALNTRYVWLVRADSTAAGHAPSNKDTLSTLPAAPSNLRTKAVGARLLYFDFDANGNPDSTRYAILIHLGANDYYWTGSDTTSVLSASVFKTHAGWGDSIRVGKYPSPIFSPDTFYTLTVKAQNADGAWGTATTLRASTSEGKTERLYLNDIVTPNFLWSFSRSSSSGDISIARGDTAVANMGADNLNVYLGMANSASNFEMFRWGLDRAIPAGGFAYACSLSIFIDLIPGIGNNFHLSAFRGLWPSDAMRYKQPYWNFATWASGINPYSGIPQLTLFDTAGKSAGNRYTVAFSDSGMNTVRNALGGRLKQTITSSRDSAGVTPPSNEYFRIAADSSYISLTYDPIDAVPSAFNMAAISKDSVLVTFTDNSYSEYKYVLVDAYTNAVVAGADSIAKNATSARIGARIPATIYRWKLKVIGGNIGGQFSNADSCATWAGTPPKPTTSMVTNATRRVIIDTSNTGNPITTKYALRDSIRFALGLSSYIYPISGTDTLGTLPWWGTYTQFGDTSGVVTVYPVGMRSAFQVLSKNTQ